MSVDLETIALLVAVLGLVVTMAGALIVGAIAWGMLRAQVSNNFRAHCELAAEVRPKVAHLDAVAAQSKAQHDTLVERVVGIKEQLDRIEGSITKKRPL